MHYRRADFQSADESLSVARRAYRPVVKDPAGWGGSKPMGGPRTRRHRIRRRRAAALAVIKERGFSQNVGRSRTRAKKGGGRCTPKTGRPAEKIGVEGEEKREGGCLSPSTAQLKSVCRAQVKHQKALHNTKKAHCTARSEPR